MPKTGENLSYRSFRGLSKFILNEKLSPLVREISWSNNVLIMMAAKTDEEREFYLLLTKKNNYSARELERQIDSGQLEFYLEALDSDVKKQN